MGAPLATGGAKCVLQLLRSAPSGRDRAPRGLETIFQGRPSRFTAAPAAAIDGADAEDDVERRERLAELRQRAEAIVAKFGQLPDDLADAGLLKAEWQLTNLRRATKELRAEMGGFRFGEEERFVGSTLYGAEYALGDFIEATEPDSTVGAAVILRELLRDKDPDDDEYNPLQHVLAVIGRQV